MKLLDYCLEAHGQWAAIILRMLCASRCGDQMEIPIRHWVCYHLRLRPSLMSGYTPVVYSPSALVAQTRHMLSMRLPVQHSKPFLPRCQSAASRS